MSDYAEHFAAVASARHWLAVAVKSKIRSAEWGPETFAVVPAVALVYEISAICGDHAALTPLLNNLNTNSQLLCRSSDATEGIDNQLHPRSQPGANLIFQHVVTSRAFAFLLIFPARCSVIAVRFASTFAICSIE
ncbi:putative transcriptional regulator protein [Klebsiella phage vB_KshKPC-M]|nr:putative transcriptional regulator protein [Klebsiella phage vB_KshKPC-M]